MSKNLMSNLSNTFNEGVVINGVKWATRNVDEPGTFADNPENSGKFYQWNRKKAWNSYSQFVGNWDESAPKGDTWKKANDPSPAGWRVPTIHEISLLFDKDKVIGEWTAENGRNGIKFTDKKTGASIFLPAEGYRLDYCGTLCGYGAGYYWSSTLLNSNDACSMLFGNKGAILHHGNLTAGQSIRSVAE